MQFMLVVHSLEITKHQHLYVVLVIFSIPVGIITHKNIPVGMY